MTIKGIIGAAAATAAMSAALIAGAHSASGGTITGGWECSQQVCAQELYAGLEVYGFNVIAPHCGTPEASVFNPQRVAVVSGPYQCTNGTRYLPVNARFSPGSTHAYINVWYTGAPGVDVFQVHPNITL